MENSKRFFRPSSDSRQFVSGEYLRQRVFYDDDDDDDAASINYYVPRRMTIEFYIKTAASPGIHNAPAYIGRTNIYDIIESHYWRAIIVDVRTGCLERSPSTSAAHAGILDEKVSATQGKGR